MGYIVSAYLLVRGNTWAGPYRACFSWASLLMSWAGPEILRMSWSEAGTAVHVEKVMSRARPGREKLKLDGSGRDTAHCVKI